MQPKSESPLDPWEIMFDHMSSEHPNAQYFGDSYIQDFKTREVIFYSCQLCGKVLVDKKVELPNAS